MCVSVGQKSCRQVTWSDRALNHTMWHQLCTHTLTYLLNHLIKRMHEQLNNRGANERRNEITTRIYARWHRCHSSVLSPPLTSVFLLTAFHTRPKSVRGQRIHCRSGRIARYTMTVFNSFALLLLLLLLFSLAAVRWRLFTAQQGLCESCLVAAAGQWCVFVHTSRGIELQCSSFPPPFLIAAG